MHELGIKNTSHLLIILKGRCLKKISSNFALTQKMIGMRAYICFFVVRKSVQESLGFSPFELIFGHTVRESLKLLKEKILSDDDSSLNLLQYVSDFKNRLSKAFEAAQSNLKSAQSKMRMHYDENAQDVNFEPGLCNCFVSASNL